MEKEFCRICLKTKADIFTIFQYKNNEYLPAVIYNVSGVKISSRREPDARICVKCSQSLVEAQKIILQCQEAEEYLCYQRLARGKSNTVSETNQAAASTSTSVYSYEFLEEEENEDIKAEEMYEVIKQEASSMDDSHSETQSASAQAQSAKITKNIPVEEMYEVIKQEVNSMDDSYSETKSQSAQAQPAKITKKANNEQNGIRSRAKSKKRFTCELCNFTTKVGKLLIAHNLERHNIDDANIYVCTLCPKRFARRPTLNRHIESEHDTLAPEKKYLCAQCGKSYIREVTLAEHIKQSHGPARYSCVEPNCHQKFTRPFTLRRHYLAVHGTESRYYCTDCDKYFRVYDLWKYHNEVVHKNMIVYCPHCGYGFRFREKLREHLQSQACMRSIIPCTYCQRRFTTQNGLREHLRNIHNIN